MSIVDDVLGDLKTRTAKTVEDLKRDLSKVRTGRASTAVLEGVMVDYYGSLTPLSGVANVTVADARQIIIKPWDRGILPAIEKAIFQTDIGITPKMDGEVVRMIFPPLNEDRRKELTKVVKNKGEEHKVAVRNERRDAKEMIDSAVDEGDLPKDDGERAVEKVQTIVDQAILAIEDVVSKKTKDVMEV